MRYRFWLLPAATMLLAASCRPTTPANDAAATAETDKETPRQEYIIRKHVNIPSDFSYITNLSSINVVYTQGNYAIDAEGDSALLNFLDVTVDSHLLTVNIRSENNSFINTFGHTSHVTLYISSPELRCVSNCGNGSFESQATWRGDDLQLGNLGTGSIKLGRVECTTFSLQSNTQGAIDIADLQAEDASLYSNGSAIINAHVDVNNLTLLNDGTQTMHLTGKANKLFISRPKDPNLKNEVQLPPTQ